MSLLFGSVQSDVYTGILLPEQRSSNPHTYIFRGIANNSYKFKICHIHFHIETQISNTSNIIKYSTKIHK